MSMYPLLVNTGSLTERLATLHQHLLVSMPNIDRVACALYDKFSDKLKTFINSTRTGQALSGYEYRLSDSHALHELARSGQFRVLDEIASAIDSCSEHSRWLKEQGYRSSFTVPLYENEQLLGFAFFDSTQPAAFTPELQRDLVLYTNLISMAIANELAVVRMVIESTRVARELTEMRDFETGTHLERIGRYSRLIARALAPRHQLSDEFVESVYLFAPMHDVGKIAIPDRILLKRAPLTPEERTIMETHVSKGMEMIERLMGKNSLHQFPESNVLRNIVQSHHEYLDGSGYPQGLRGEQIPLEARIVTVADIFDALTAPRPYKAEWSVAQALAELDRLAHSGKIDPECVAALAQHVPDIEDIRRQYTDQRP